MQVRFSWRSKLFLALTAVVMASCCYILISNIKNSSPTSATDFTPITENITSDIIANSEMFQLPCLTSGQCWEMQGFTVIDNKLYFPTIDSVTDGIMYSANFGDSSSVSSTVVNNIYHANDLTAKNGQIYMVGPQNYSEVFRYSPNMQYLNNYSLSILGTNDYPSAIAYDYDDDYFILMYRAYNAVTLYYVDSDFSSVKKIVNTEVGNINATQGTEYRDGYYYMVTGSGTHYANIKIYVYNSDLNSEHLGEIVRVYEVDSSTDKERGGEIESISFDGGYVYFNSAVPYDCDNGWCGMTYTPYRFLRTSVNNIITKATQTVSFAESSISKDRGAGNFTNKATTTGDGAITYSSSDSNIAEVNAITGEVTINGTGTAIITATAEATPYFTNASATYTLTIPKASQTVTFANSSVTKTYGDAAFTNKATTTGDGAITYSSSNTSVATVDSNGKVTIKSAGHTVITATASATTNYSSASDSYNLAVEKSSQNVSFTNASVTKTYGDAAFTNKATTTGDGAITYASTNNAIATVDNNGKVTINAAGTVTIIATAEGTNNCVQATADYSLTINKATQVVSFEEEAKTITIDFGTADFVNKATTSNPEATISYASSDDKVATVDKNGKIVTKKSGKAIITATASNENFEEVSNSYELNIQYVLTFDMNGGTGAVEQQACISKKNFTDCEVVIPSDIPSREGLFFLGWSEDSSDIEATYYVDEEISITNNKKLYAVWTDGQITWVQDNEHTLGDDGNLTVEINVPLEQFDHVEVDGDMISEEKYQLKNGSTVLTLKASFLNTLSEGKHDLAIVYDNDSAVMTTFEIKKKAEAPNTGKETRTTDQATALLSIFIPISFSFVGTIIVVINRRRSHRKVKF